MDSPGKVLIVDDEQLMVEFLDGVLKAAGFETILASDGKEALDKMSEERPHLILLDINMPEMSGMEVLKSIRQNSDYAGLAIAMLTGRDEESQIVEAFENGADDYISKPFKNQKLISQIQNLIDKASKGELPSQSLGKR